MYLSISDLGRWCCSSWFHTQRLPFGVFFPTTCRSNLEGFGARGCSRLVPTFVFYVMYCSLVVHSVVSGLVVGGLAGVVASRGRGGGDDPEGCFVAGRLLVDSSVSAFRRVRWQCALCVCMGTNQLF